MQQGVLERPEAASIPAANPGKQKSLTQRAFLNALASVLDLVAKLGVRLVITPVLVHGLGRSLFGVWEILDSLVGYMAAADGRPTNALKWVVANRQDVDSPEASRRNVGSALAVWLLFLPLLLTAGGVLVWVAPRVTGVGPELHAPVRLAGGLLVLNFILTGLCAIPGAVLHGMNLAHKRMGFVAALNLLGGALFAAAIHFRWGLVGLAVSEILLSVITGVAFWRLVRRYVPWFGVARPSRAEVRSFFGLSFWYSAWTLVGKLLTESEVVLIGALASAAAVTPYVITSYAARSILSVMMIALGAVTPGLGTLIGGGQFERALSVRREMLTLTWLLTSVSAATILLANRSFIGLWVGPDHYPGVWVDFLIVLTMAQLAFVRTESYIIDVTLRLRDKVYLGAVSVAVTIGLAFFLVPRLHLVGLGLAVLTGRMLLSVGYPVLVRRYLQAGSRRLLDLVRPGLVSLALLAAGGYLGQQLHLTHWLTWGAASAAGFCLFAAAAFGLGLSGSERRQVVHRLRAAGGKRRG